MGGGSYSSKDFTAFASTRMYDKASTRTEDIFKPRTIDESLDPKKFSIREAVDGLDNPNSTPCILGLDVTGSMAPVLDVVARKGLKTICEEIYKRKPITDPALCVLGIGDFECDRQPFQATQFEADIRIFEQMEKLYLEQGGGGNHYESYIAAWYFALYRTKTDSFSKRGKRGYIFTIGDENCTPTLHADKITKHMGDKDVRSFSAQELYDLVSIEWDVYHIILKQGSHARHYFDTVNKSWCDIIGAQHVIPLDDHNMLGETIVSILEMTSGDKDLAAVTATWDGSTAVVVESALKNVAKGASSISKSIDSFL